MKMRLLLSTLCLLLFLPIGAFAKDDATKKADIAKLLASDNSNQAVIDYSLYQQFLQKNRKTNLASGVAGFDYANISAGDKALLKQHFSKMQALNITQYNDDAQLAFWINMYNVMVLDMILDFYPIEAFPLIEVKSEQPVWKMQRAEMMGLRLSLDNIQHDILREKFDDWRILNGLNVAAVSSGPWQEKPFTGKNIIAQLDAHTKQLFTYKLTADMPETNILRLIAGLKWYENDFIEAGITLDEILQQYLPASLKQKFGNVQEIEYFYDWRLNQP